MARVIPLSRPEGGAEHSVTFETHHNCPQGKVLRAALEDPDVDLLMFPVGTVGWEMPLDTPFAVEAQMGCGACGADVAAWFEWRGPRYVTPALWTPGAAA